MKASKQAKYGVYVDGKLRLQSDEWDKCKGAYDHFVTQRRNVWLAAIGSCVPEAVNNG